MVLKWQLTVSSQAQTFTPPSDELAERFNISYDASYWGAESSLHSSFPAFQFPGLGKHSRPNHVAEKMASVIDMLQILWSAPFMNSKVWKGRKTQVLVVQGSSGFPPSVRLGFP